jgi:RHS repeat-associated protein
LQGYSGGDGVRQQFTHKERDNETGLDYFLARYYSSTQGRFTSVDPGNAGANGNDPQSWNGYAYARNNPTLYSDPDGRTFKICYQGGDCHEVTDEQFNQIKGDATKLGSVFKSGTIYNEVDGQLVATGTYQRTAFDDLSDQANAVIFGSNNGAGLVDRLRPVQQVVETGFYIDMAIISGGTTLGSVGGMQLGLSTFGGGVTRAMLQAAAADAGPTVEVVTKLTQAPQLGRGLSVATGEGATALANAARAGGRIFTARIPKALIETLKRARLVEERVTQMGGARAVELRFRPEAAEFIVNFFY